MDIKGYVYKSAFAKKHRAEGEAKGRAEALLGFIRARGFTLTEEQRERVLACTDLATLDMWIERAAVARSMTEVLG